MAAITLAWALQGVSPTQAETLVEALVSAYSTNPTLRSDRARQRATDEAIPQALSGWRPTVTARGSFGRSWSDTNVTSTYAHSPASVSIELAQPIFRGFKTINATRSAEASVEAGKQRLVGVEQNIIFEALQAYMDVLRDEQILALRRQNQGALRQQVNDASARFKVGEITRTDVAQARAREAGAIAATASARAELEASKASYLKIIGHAPSKLKYPKMRQLPKSLEEAQSVALEVNPGILGAAFEEDSARADVEVTRGDLLPELSVVASGTATNSPEAGVKRSQSASVEGVLVVPLYEAGLTYSRVRQAKQVASQRRLDVIVEGRRVRESVSNAWNSLEAARQSIVASAAQVSASQLALEGVRKEYQVGSRSTLDVLNAQSELISARITQVSAEHDRVVASFLLLNSIGLLTARQLDLPVAYYDADKNTAKVRHKFVGTGADTVE